jgi:hypothetical protein
MADFPSDFIQEYNEWTDSLDDDVDAGEIAMNRWAEEVAERRAARMRHVLSDQQVCQRCETTVLPHLLTCPERECPYFVEG